jgi:hypothetical protein
MRAGTLSRGARRTAYEREKGSTSVSQVTRASGLRVCVWIVPGPVNCITKPSPLLTVLMSPVAALRVVKAMPGSNATR